jgi:hypothetical protein
MGENRGWARQALREEERGDLWRGRDAWRVGGSGRPTWCGRDGGGRRLGDARAGEEGARSGGPLLEERGGVCGPNLENVGWPGRRKLGRARRNSECFDLFKQFSNKFELL